MNDTTNELQAETEGKFKVEKKLKIERATNNEKGTKKEEIMIYIGPSIPGIVTENKLFCNGIPEELKAQMISIPAISSLLVPVKRLAEAKMALQRKNTAENVCYKKIMEAITG